jgi:hypothetical protein
MLLLYIAEKERRVVSAFTSTRNTFLGLKAANLTKIMNAKLMLRGDAIISYPRQYAGECVCFRARGDDDSVS